LVASLPKTQGNQSTINDASSYLKWMQASGYGAPDIIGSGVVGWAGAEELVAAVRGAGSTDEHEVQNALQHQKMDAIGIAWARTQDDYAKINQIRDATMIVKPDGSQQVFQAG
jgi:hypothetical protein